MKKIAKKTAEKVAKKTSKGFLPKASSASGNSGVLFDVFMPSSLKAECKSLAVGSIANANLVFYDNLSNDIVKKLNLSCAIGVIYADELKAKIKQLPSGFPKRGHVILAVASSSEISTWENLKIDPVFRELPMEYLKVKIQREIGVFTREAESDELKRQSSSDNDILDMLNHIGKALSTERDLDALMSMIVKHCRALTFADAGSLYLIEKDPDKDDNPNDWLADKRMCFQVAQNFSRKVPFSTTTLEISKKTIYGRVAITQKPLRIADVYKIKSNAGYSWGGRGFDESIGYRTKSMLTVPMVNSHGQTIGVIQLINHKIKQDLKLETPEEAEELVTSFSKREESWMASVASQASIALQNTQLISSIRNLFEGFINASAQAIESRDPTTSGHSYRVAILTVGLAEEISKLQTNKEFREINYSKAQLEEIRYAALLHDFGKIGVREHVLIKAKKLYPHQYQQIIDRLEYIRTLITLQYTKKELALLKGLSKGEQSQAALVKKTQDGLKKALAEVDEISKLLTKCNEPIMLTDEQFQKLKEIRKTSFTNLHGKLIPYISDKELTSFKIPRGSLTEKDRLEIESHVTHTYNFLSKIPWTPDLKLVPDIAHAHHEKLDGSGYPRKLLSKKIPPQAKIMTIADIFDALTALDRPYKKSLPVEKALEILKEEAFDNHINKDMLEVFIEKRIYQMVIKDGRHLY